MIAGRSLHYVFKIGDRAKNAHFFLNILGMKVLRHEEFQEGCDAQCNGPYDNRWSKTMVGYGPESKHFVMELTYNYGISSYELGNDFSGITIRSRDIIKRAKENNCPVLETNGQYNIKSPDGYTFFVLDEEQPVGLDPIVKTSLFCTNLETSINYWHDILKMKIVKKEEKSVILNYFENEAQLELIQSDIADTALNRAKAFGRIAFAVPSDMQTKVDEIIKKNNKTILTPLISLDTPGKATVRVIILADPDGHEICFVDEEGYSSLSEVDPEGDNLLDKFINKDPFQK